MLRYSAEAFEVHSSQRNFYLRCASQRERGMWIAGLCSLCGLRVEGNAGVLWPPTLGPLPRPPRYILSLRSKENAPAPEYEDGQESLRNDVGSRCLRRLSGRTSPHRRE
jgi:hypothetical protein